MSDIPRDIEQRLQGFLKEIARVFKAPRITLIVRGPQGDDGNARGDLVLTNDDPLFIEKALRALIIGRAQILAGTPQQMNVTEREPTLGGLTPHLEDGGDPANYQPRKGR